MTDQHHDHDRAPTELGWHLKKEVNLSIIISVIGIAVAAITGYTDLRKDIELIKADTAVLHQRDTQNADDIRSTLKATQEHYARLEQKIDRLIERNMK